MVVKREGNPHALQRKITRETIDKVVREIVGKAQPGLTLVTSISASTKSALIAHMAESLDITLDNLAGVRRLILLDGWI